MVGAGAVVFALWPYIITNARPDDGSLIDLNPVAVAAILGCSPTEVSDAINFLCSPDELSRTSTANGCRLIKKGPLTYFVVNLEKYRFEKDKDRRREYWRKYKQIKRSQNVPVDKSGHSTMSIHADADADADADAKKNGEVKLSPVERIGLEKERERLDKSVQSLKVNEFRTQKQTQEMKDIRVRIQKIDAALHIQLP